ncbi:7000_t:CDS:2 [Funneliformis geosporum]|uniref:7000_t:CDS:1 n=1 Tax=Funneliformis geosporum TaxID=1117311 RepID=A0A9W4WRE4_9GLOM|nr:7000_t:CDS:2 [Funneliformis geosporum]
MFTDKKCISGTVSTDYFSLVVRRWRENDTFFTKKTHEPIENFRLQIVVSKKNVSKLAVVRARIRRRIRESARFALPIVGIKRHDYLFFANLKAYDAPWLRLCSVVESAIGNSKLYRTEKSHASGFRGRSYTGNYASNEKQDLKKTVENKYHQKSQNIKDK